MKISQERLQEFIRIYEKEFGATLTEGAAQLIAGRLMFFYERLARPLPSEQRQHDEDVQDAAEEKGVAE